LSRGTNLTSGPTCPLDRRGVRGGGRRIDVLLALILGVLCFLPILKPPLAAEALSQLGMTDAWSHPMTRTDREIPPTPLDGGVLITNKGNASDYPGNVTGGQPYPFNVSLTFDVPDGGNGTLSILAGPCFHVDPPPILGLGCLRFPEFLMEYGPGAHAVKLSFDAPTPTVHRDSVAVLAVWAALSTGGHDEYYIDTKVLPIERAQDVVLLATVLDPPCAGVTQF